MDKNASVWFRVYGDVLGKPRPRVNRNGRVWTPAKFKEYEKKIAKAYTDWGGQLREGPVEICVAVYRELPKSRSKKTVSEPDTFKPDIDNILKIVMDALNGVAYKDDSQVTKVYIAKHDRTRSDEFLDIVVKSTE